LRRTGTGGSAIAGVLLGRAVLDDLMVFTLPHVDQCDYVLQAPSGPGGFNEGDRFYADYLHAGLPEGYHLLVNSAKH
jgi:hypothetical protein